MMRWLSVIVSGLLFGAGIALSGMINPSKILNFFDVAGTWDPSLAFVMAGGVVTALIGYQLIFKIRSAPLFDTKFHLPTKNDIDLPLIAGSAVFGIGWGLAGFCPGGSIPALGLGQPQAFIFVAAMLVGLGATKILRARFS
jgi:uncharacterized membrane protein YedE/YeeE